MTTDRHTAVQLARLSSVNHGKAIGKPELAEYGRVVRAAAKSDYQVATAITSWLDSQMFPPSPAELRAMLESTSPAPHHEGDDCKVCSCSGRRSFWAVVQTEFWQDSGSIRQRTVREMPVLGDPNYWLMSRPANEPDDTRERMVVLLSGYCRCGHGRRLRDMVRGGQAA